MGFRLALIFLILLSLVSGVEGASLTGNVYEWSTLEPISNVIVEINTLPVQSIVVKAGTYSFNIPPGKYIIEAKYYQNNLLEYHTIENITIEGEGEFIFDLIMFPSLEFEEFFTGEELGFEEIFQEENLQKRNNIQAFLLITSLIILIILITVGILRYKELKKRKQDNDDLPQDLVELLQIIDNFGGRINQKELRKELDLSEAKISLMITDLESRGRVKKIKKGRGNIVIKK